MAEDRRPDGVAHEGPRQYGSTDERHDGERRSPGEEETHALLDYLQGNAQVPIRTRRYADLATAGWSFREACSQCHVLPDPASRRRQEWRKIVERMSRNMQWMNRVVGSRPDAREPQLAVDEIVGYLERNAKQD